MRHSVRQGTARQQSAMEYLMTYGWSILIIAIVLAALFSLGVFSNSNLGAHAQPNSCRVYRPNGPGTTTNINLEGVCNGELPQFVTQFNGLTGSQIVIAPYSGTSTSAVTVSVWINDASFSTPQFYVDKGYGGGGGWALSESGTGQVYFDFTPSTNTNTGCGTISTGTWVLVTGVSNGANDYCYVNGALVSSVANVFTPTTSSSYDVGSNGAGTYYCNCMISNVQLYGAALDANAIQSLYLEGIGGAPVEPQNIEAWWPLNGDYNDYSGEGGQIGVPTNVGFISTWTSGYTQP